MAAACRMRSTLRSENSDSFLLCNALHAKPLSASSNNNRDDSGGGFPSFDDLKQSLKTVKPEFESQTSQPNDGKFRSSRFEDFRASLRNIKPPPSPAYGAFSGSASKVPSLEEVQKNLSEFRTKSAPPLWRNSEAGKPLPGRPPFQSQSGSNFGEGKDGKDRLSFEFIRDSLRQVRSSSPEKEKTNNNDSAASFSLKAFGHSLGLKPDGRGEERGQRFDSPSSQGFGSGSKAGGEFRTPTTEFVKMYSHDELGQKLRKLRPQAEQGEEQEKKRFSLTELNERLKNLREMEEKESSSNIGGLSFKDLRESLFQLRTSKEKNNQTSSWHRLSMLGQLGGQTIPDFMTLPPKDNLVERYFHPDNMSAEEKMKIELKKVREEFKKHEADCGSSSVQVAQLTAKIKYLGKVLRKKDKHSRKGLQEMIQKRKKLLKYLRRTDWDSYCFVVSKLGLRDNPDYKT